MKKAHLIVLLKGSSAYQNNINIIIVCGLLSFGVI